MLASLAEGESRIKGGVAAKHVQSTIEVLTGLGTQIEKTADGFVVRGGLPYRPLRDTVSVGSSGTTLYFMIGLASLADAPVTITGQKYFQRRPVGPLLEALSDCGIELSSANATPPITVAAEAPARRPGLDRGDAQPVDLRPDHRRAVRRRADNDRGRGHPERAALRRTDREHDAGLRARGRRVRRLAPLRDRGQPDRPPADVTLPPDIGSLAFGLAATSIHPSDVFFHGVTEIDGARVDHPEAHFLDVVAEMGLPMELDREAGGDARAPRRGAAARGRDRLPADARHAAGALHHGPVRRGRDPLLQRRPRAAEGVRPGRLDAAAEPHGRGRRRAGRRAGRARDRGRPDRLPPLQLQRPPRAHVADRGGVAGARRELADLPERLPDLLSRLPRRHAGDRLRPLDRGRPRALRRGRPGGDRRGRGRAAGGRVDRDRPGGGGADRRLGRALGARAAGRGRAGRRAGGRHPGLDLGGARPRGRQGRVAAAGARRRAGRDRRLPAAELGRVRDPDPGLHEDRRDLLRPDADLPRARDRLRPAPLEGARAGRRRRVPGTQARRGDREHAGGRGRRTVRATARPDGDGAARRSSTSSSSAPTARPRCPKTPTASAGTTSPPRSPGRSPTPPRSSPANRRRRRCPSSSSPPARPASRKACCTATTR